MPTIPQDRRPDSTLAFRRKPYEFISDLAEHYRSDIVQTRLLGRKTICLRGAYAAEVFYDEEFFRRSGAAPLPIQKTLFGTKGVQTLDAEEHRLRKAMLLSLMEPKGVSLLGELFAQSWRAELPQWEGREKIIFYRELRPILLKAVAAWAGVPLWEEELEQRVRQLTALFDAAADIGPRHLYSRLSRRLSRKWLAGIVRATREQRYQPPPGSAVAVISFFRNSKNELLSLEEAADEVLNILRPTIAVSVFLTFTALALHQHPRSIVKIEHGDADYLEAFIQEVRRFYPFFPVVAAVSRQEFEWMGFRFPPGQRVLLDLYGTNHDPRVFEEPHTFQPERFLERSYSEFAFIPQGGGEVELTHRCPGEAITVELMRRTAEILVHELTYQLPPQDLRINMKRLPALPESGLIFKGVKTRKPELKIYGFEGTAEY